MSIRLIDVETLRLKSFNSQNTPLYAILSHTWDEDEEVGFKEMCQIAENPSHPAMARFGYRKIAETCHQAMRHGLDYAWVDTCCIDKTSSAELSEAINSMFRWYRDAQVCFVYLSDYYFLGNNEEDMKECKWFTRGWCLQELIAPDHLIFYDRAWRMFGSKQGLQDLVASITGINQSVFKNHTEMYSLPVAQRMSWASSRTTTRVEDMAYCLLGIFDIHIPMLYGEGEKAFERLQEEIVRRFNDTSIFLFHPSVTQKQIGTSFYSTIDDSSILDNDDQAFSNEDYVTEVKSLEFCGMFATSPAEFSSCGNIVHRPNSRIPFGREAFSVTNRGIQIGRQSLYCIRWKHCFMWETAFCHSSNMMTDFVLDGAIFLRKIGPNLFARVLPPSLTRNVVAKPVLYDDACILLRMSPSTSQQIRNTLKAAVRIQLNSRSESVAHLSEPTPRDDWDESGKLFLIHRVPLRDNPFAGSVRIDTVKNQDQAFCRTYQDHLPDIFLHFKIVVSIRKYAYALLSTEARLEEGNEWPKSQKAFQSHTFGPTDGLHVNVQVFHEGPRVPSLLFTYQVDISESQHLKASE